MQYIQNPAGGIHSVDDTFELPTDESGQVIPGWSFVTVEQVPPHILGTEPDPVVTAVESHDGGADVPDSPSADAVGTPVSLPEPDLAEPISATPVPEGETPEQVTGVPVTPAEAGTLPPAAVTAAPDANATVTTGPDGVPVVTPTDPAATA